MSEQADPGSIVSDGGGRFAGCKSKARASVMPLGRMSNLTLAWRRLGRQRDHDLGRAPPSTADGPCWRARDPVLRWTVVIPVYNEAGFLPATLASLIAQERPFRLILVDNGSTDDGIAAARRKLARSGIPHEILEEDRPGQVHALAAGIARADTEFVAICDADTLYPPGYLAAAERLFDTGGTSLVMVGAWLRPGHGGKLRAFLARLHRLAAARLWRKQNHTSGAGQCFRTESLRAAGGYDAARWPYVLKDHELAHRVLKLGSQAYSADLWCTTSPRRADRKAVRWTLAERLLYHATPFALKDWFFYRFLAGRLRGRNQRDTVLRQRSWEV